MGARQRFRGRIAGVGSTSGVRVVVGWWPDSPFGAFADAMVETASGHRVLLAPTDEVAAFVAGTYTFDEVRVEPFEVRVEPLEVSGVPRDVHVEPAEPLLPHPPRDSRSRPEPSSSRGFETPAKVKVPVSRWVVASPSLSLELSAGGRTGLGRLLRLAPPALAGSPAFATIADPVARVVLRGVRTRGTARAGRREYYGATDVRAVTAMAGSFDGVDLGAPAPVDPPCRFGFSSTPVRPSVTDVVTTVVDA